MPAPEKSVGGDGEALCPVSPALPTAHPTVTSHLGAQASARVASAFAKNARFDLRRDALVEEDVLVVTESSKAPSTGEFSPLVARHPRERDVGGGSACLPPRVGSSRRALGAERHIRVEGDQTRAAISPLPGKSSLPLPRERSCASPRRDRAFSRICPARRPASGEKGRRVLEGRCFEESGCHECIDSRALGYVATNDVH